MNTIKNLQKIDDLLSVSGQLNQENLQQISKQGFKSILNLRSPNENGFLKDEAKYAANLGLNYLNIPIQLTEINDEIVNRTLSAIKTLPKPLLISCRVGFRAKIIAMLYQAIKQKMTPEEAFTRAARNDDSERFTNLQIKGIFERYVIDYSNYMKSN